MKKLYPDSEDNDEKQFGLTGERYPLLFKIPNPFDDIGRDKKKWFNNKIKKLEQMAQTERKRLEILAFRQIVSQQDVKIIKAYCSRLPKSRFITQAP